MKTQQLHDLSYFQNLCHFSLNVPLDVQSSSTGLPQPKLSGTSLMPLSGMNAGNAENRTSVGNIFLTCARKSPSPEEHCGDTIPAWTERIPNKHTKKNLSISLVEGPCLTVMANSRYEKIHIFLSRFLTIALWKESSAVSWYLISALKKQIHWHETEHVYIWAICERKQAFLNLSVALKKSLHHYNIHTRKLMEEDFQDLPGDSQLHFEMGHSSFMSLTGKNPHYPSSLPSRILLTVVWQKPKERLKLFQKSRLSSQSISINNLWQ